MKKPTFFFFLFFALSQLIHGQDISYSDAKKNKCFLSFSLGMNILTFRKNDSEYLKKSKQGNLNFVGELLGSTSLLFTNKNNLYSCGFSLISQDYIISNSTSFSDLFNGSVSNAPFYNIEYKITTNEFQIGYGRLITKNKKENKKENKITFFQFILAADKIATSKTKIKYYASSTPSEIIAMNEIITHSPSNKVIPKIILALGTRSNLDDSGLGISFDFYMQKTLTEINKMFGGKPSGFGVRLGITHQFY